MYHLNVFIETEQVFYVAFYNNIPMEFYTVKLEVKH